MKQLILVDGNNVAFADYHTHRTETTESGVETGLLDGFLKSLLKLARVFPGAVQCIIWDGSGPNWRKELSGGRYKGNRIYAEGDPVRESCFRQIDGLKEILTFCQVPQVTPSETEADDAIAVLASTLADDFDRVIVRSGDQDLFQVVDAKVSTLRGFPPGRPVNSQNVDSLLVTPLTLKARYGLTPKLWPMYRALMGDASDNLAGLTKGVGDVTARELIAGGLRVPVSIEKVPKLTHKRLARMDVTKEDWLRVNENYLLSLLPRSIEEVKSPRGRNALEVFCGIYRETGFRRNKTGVNMWKLGKMLGQFELNQVTGRMLELVNLF